ncbi:hypothetical protein EXIGLDRAFT_839795 [Exidia glandulosa HHB12029]|uniref:F-box domain-containing protein n=1 Tax=Exidia glandulosa HHB12029 TaxID=1314781 RepID=A0A165EU96_EXIGL|nr:hypothetical protein EXIGLDRAFT_839795 [Exidia glandulosa HHB12029]
MVAFRQLLCWNTGPLLEPPTQSSAAARLPSDVLCTIFALLNFGDRIRTSHVSVHWRAASLAYLGLLWSLIITRGRRRGTFREQLERAKGAPVTVVISFYFKGRFTWIDTTRELDRSFKALADHMAHVQSLRIFVLTRNKRHVHTVVQSLRAIPAPQLCRLRLVIPQMRARYPSPFISDDIFGREAPLLTKVRLDLRVPNPIPSAFRHVEALHLSLGSESGAVTLMTLSTMSRLRDLHLCDFYYPSATPTTAWPIALRSLYLENVFVPRVLPYFGAENVQNVWVKHYAAAIDDAFPTEDPQLNVRAYLHQTFTRTLDIVQADGKYRCVIYPRTVDVPARFIEHLTDVIIDERYLLCPNSEDRTLSLSCVLRLVIVLMDAHNLVGARYDDTLLHCVSHASCTSVACPALEVLNVRAAESSNNKSPRAVLGPEQVLALLGHVDYGDGTLDGLLISGAEVVTHLTAPFYQLLSAAESFVVDYTDTEVTKLEGVPQPVFDNAL